MGSALDGWIYWHFGYNYNQQLIIHGWLRLAPFLTGLRVFSLLVTGLVLIHGSVTSSASVVRWLTHHSWTLNFWILCTTQLRLNRSSVHGSLYSLARIHANLCWIFVDMRTRFSESLASNGLSLWLHYSSFQASCHNIELKTVKWTI
jgi:hypothetical protein